LADYASKYKNARQNASITKSAIIHMNSVMTTRAPLSGLHRRLISGGTWAILGKGVMAATGLAINAVIARIISPDELGAYFLVVSIATLATSFALMGMHVAVVRLIAEAMAGGLPGKGRAAVTTALRLCVTSALAVGMLVGTGGEFIAKHVFASDAMAKVMWLVAIWVAGLTIINLLAESFRGFHDYGFATMFSGVISNIVIVTLLTGILIWYRNTDLPTILTVSISASAVSIFLAGYFMRQKFARLGETVNIRAREMMGIGLPLMVTGLTIFVLTQADLWVIGIFGSEEQVATFGTAARLGQLVFIPLLISNTVLPPFISEMYSQGKAKELEKVIRAMSTIAAIPAVVVLMAFIFYSDSILSLVYGDYYTAASVPLMLMSAGQLINVLSGSGLITLMMTGHQRSAMNISIIFGGIIVVGALAVIRPYGVTGVAAVTGSVTAAMAFFTLFWVRFRTGMWTHVGLGSVSDVIKKLRRTIW
jgi:O-antigen/teichoic acid export membrane protein